MGDRWSTRSTNPVPLGKLSKEKIEEIYEIRKALQERARQKVDPAGIGLDAVMMATDDGDFFGVTEEAQFQDWLDWAQQVVSVISLVSQRIGLAIASAGFAIAGSTMVSNERSLGLGQASLAVSAVFAVWFALANVMRVKR
jgi:hypothetical protein